MTQQTRNQIQRWLRIAAFVLVCGLLLWLPVEETSERYAILFGFGIYTWWSIRWLITHPPDAKGFIIRHLLMGILAGPGVTLVASFLMVFKIGLHLHPTPDFTLVQFYSVLLRTPVWIGIGFILGLGLGLLRLSWRDISALPGDRSPFP